MPRCYVDNAKNRSLGRVGLPHGTAVHSGGSSLCTFVRTYVDNYENHRLGRVGLPCGSEPHSRNESSPSLSLSFLSSFWREPSYSPISQNSRCSESPLSSKQRSPSPLSRSLKLDSSVRNYSDTPVSKKSNFKGSCRSSNQRRNPSPRSRILISARRKYSEILVSQASSQVGTPESFLQTRSLSPPSRPSRRANRNYDDSPPIKKSSRVRSFMDTSENRSPSPPSKTAKFSSSTTRSHPDKSVKNNSAYKYAIRYVSSPACRKDCYGYTSHNEPESSRSQVDNSKNQDTGSVGLSCGSAFQSQVDSASSFNLDYSKTYMENQKQSQISHPLGIAVISVEESYPAQSHSFSRQNNRYRCSASKRKYYVVGIFLGSKPVRRGHRQYINNAINRRLHRIGLRIGTQAVSKRRLAHLHMFILCSMTENCVYKPAVGGEALPEDFAVCNKGFDSKSQVDNSQNQDTGSVGLSCGSAFQSQVDSASSFNLDYSRWKILKKNRMFWKRMKPKKKKGGSKERAMESLMVVLSMDFEVVI